jgi:hypothetical protein
MDIIPIATLITAIATLALAGATFYYAYTNRKLMLTKEKELNKPRKIDELESIIKPLISQCQNENKRIKEKSYWLIFEDKTFLEKIEDNTYKKLVYDGLINKQQKLKNDIEIHDNIIKHLKDEYKKFEEKINNNFLEEKTKELINEYNKKSKTNITNTDWKYYSGQIIRFLLAHQEMRQILSSGEPFQTFWDKIGVTISELIKREPYSIDVKNIKNIAEKLIEKNNEILKILKIICDSYTKNYGISLDKVLFDLWER